MSNEDEGTLSELSVERYHELCRVVLTLLTNDELPRCDAMRFVVDEEWYEEHIAHQPNMMLTCSMELPEGILGMVIVRDVPVEGRHCNLFLICVKPGIAGAFKQFTIAHELGHVLMHGSLLYAGMVLPERMWSHCKELDERRRLMELEANVYALLSIVPTPAITQLQSILGGVELMPEVLAEAMTWLRKQPFPLSLARERLILHGIVTSAPNMTDDFKKKFEEFKKGIWNRNVSWTYNGAAGMLTALPEKADCTLLTPAQLKEWRARLEFPTYSVRSCGVGEQGLSA